MTPLNGFYSSSQYVIVLGKTQQEDLNLLGFFGVDLESAKRKDESRRGPEDRRIVNLNDGKSSEPTTVLSLNEAFYLAYALGHLTINEKSDGNDDLYGLPMSLADCWEKFRSYYSQSNIQLDFAVEYGVYHYFRSRGWIVRGGENYGTNFLLYRDSPTIDHAQYSVIVIPECDDNSMANQDTRWKWESFLTFHRVSQSVSKELLLAFVLIPKHFEVDINHPRCIKNMRIITQEFSAHANTII